MRVIKDKKTGEVLGEADIADRDKAREEEKAARERRKAEKQKKYATFLRGFFSDEEFAKLSPDLQKRILEGKSVEGWSEEGSDRWLHDDDL